MGRIKGISSERWRMTDLVEKMGLGLTRSGKSIIVHQSVWIDKHVNYIKAETVNKVKVD